MPSPASSAMLAAFQMPPPTAMRSVIQVKSIIYENRLRVFFPDGSRGATDTARFGDHPGQIACGFFPNRSAVRLPRVFGAPLVQRNAAATRAALLTSFSRKPLSTIAARIELSATRNSELAAQAGLARQSNEIRTSIFSINRSEEHTFE